jgi:hypothetical protein
VKRTRSGGGWAAVLYTLRVARKVGSRQLRNRAGDALLYFPEANVLVPTKTDPLSKIPAFKAVPVTLESLGAVPVNGSTNSLAERVALEVVRGS